MLPVEAQIKNIQDKLQQLVKRQQAMRRDNQRLQKELEKARAEVREKEATLQKLQQQVDARQIGTGPFSEPEKAALQKRIDNYLREIDRCLALLNT
ncbi:MAG TPA: hypothetical protein VG890_06385 [Puia sp.]|nr:hypothetical protein [Puia sp.]